MTRYAGPATACLDRAGRPRGHDQRRRGDFREVRVSSEPGSTSGSDRTEPRAALRHDRQHLPPTGVGAQDLRRSLRRPTQPRKEDSEASASTGPTSTTLTQSPWDLGADRKGSRQASRPPAGTTLRARETSTAAAGPSGRGWGMGAPRPPKDQGLGSTLSEWRGAGFPWRPAGGGARGGDAGGTPGRELGASASPPSSPGRRAYWQEGRGGVGSEGHGSPSSAAAPQPGNRRVRQEESQVT